MPSPKAVRQRLVSGRRVASCGAPLKSQKTSGRDQLGRSEEGGACPPLERPSGVYSGSREAAAACAKAAGSDDCWRPMRFASVAAAASAAAGADSAAEA